DRFFTHRMTIPVAPSCWWKTFADERGHNCKSSGRRRWFRVQRLGCGSCARKLKLELSTLKVQMTPEQWHRVKEVFEAALEHAPEQRSAFLGQACDGDDLLCNEVKSLLSSYEQAVRKKS